MKRFMKVIALCLVVALLVPTLGCKKEATQPVAEPSQVDIRTAAELRDALRNSRAGVRYTLLQDIDLGGEAWTPVAFQGELDGNGKQISNFTLLESVEGNQGFFASLDGTVKNLHLENVALTADSSATAVGMLAGVNRGYIEACTVTGSMEATQSDLCIGVLVGRNEGTLLGGGDLLTATAGSENPADIAQGLSAKVALHLPEDRVIGLAGQGSVENVDIAMLWQDASASFNQLPESEQQRRLAVVDMMRQMGTVEWTTSEEISYTANDNRQSVHSNVFIPGRTYVGLPYSGCEGSFARFLTQMQAQTDDLGRYVTVTGLEDGIKNKDGTVSGFVLNMGNDCVGAVIWALAASVPYSVEDGGMEFLTPINMVPNAYNMENFGALPVGDYQLIQSDTEKYADGLDARDTKTIIALNGGAVKMAEYYAKAYRGDYLLCLNYTYDATTDKWKKTSNHGRMLAYEPMIIRGWDGNINLEESYVLTHEQGDGLYDNRLENGKYEPYQGYNLKNTSWRTDYRYSLSLLLTKSGYDKAYLPGTGYGYVPVTVAAYTVPELAQPTFREATQITLPNQGTYESNYLLINAKMTIQDDQGNTVYEKTAYLPYRVFADFQYLKLDELFPDAAENLQAGKTYYETLETMASNGETYKVLDHVAFP